MCVMENVIYALVALVSLASMGMVMAKAGQPWWAILVPLYNLLIMLRIAGKPGWWLLLLLVPVLNVAILIIMSMAIAERFGKGSGFGVCLALFPPVAYPILAFGSSEYVGAELQAIEG